MTHSDTKVLVVEDERDLADTYALWLGEVYDVELAYSGAAALEAVDETVDVVLLDRRMPGTSGDEVLERIRAAEHTCRVAMITAVQPDFDIVEMGFDDYLVKPVFGDALRDMVERLVRRSAYDETAREYFALVSKRAALVAHRTDLERQTSEEFAALEARIDEVEATLDETVSSMDAADFAALFRDIDRHET